MTAQKMRLTAKRFPRYRTWIQHWTCFQEIERLKKEKNAVMLAHYYQEPDIQDVADYIGDSLGSGTTGRKNQGRHDRFCRCALHGGNSKDPKPNKKSCHTRSESRLFTQR